MLNLALAGLESAINAALQLDPETLERLKKLENKIIAIQITDWNITFYITVHADGIALSTTTEQTPDTTLSGTLAGLFHVGRAKGSGEALFKHKINFQGDIAVGESIRSIMGNLDIDWEEHLSHFVGDVAAHRIGRGARRSVQFAKKFSQDLRNNLREFLQQEAALLPTATEVEAFIEDVQTLKNDVDRAEARLKRLLAQKGSSS